MDQWMDGKKEGRNDNEVYAKVAKKQEITSFVNGDALYNDKRNSLRLMNTPRSSRRSFT